MKKLRHGFADEVAMITATLISSCYWKTLTFLLEKEKAWKRIFNTNVELLQNLTEKQIMSFKSPVNWLLNDIWHYLVTGCVDWKICVFQQICKGSYLRGQFN